MRLHFILLLLLTTQAHGQEFSRQVDSLINEARTTKKLELKGLDLTTIPRQVFELKDLEELNLFDNELKEIPDDIGKLKELRILTLNWNHIDKISSELFKLSHLKELSFYYGGELKNSRSLKKNIQKLKNLESLDLEGASLKRMPKGITRLSKLTELNLTGCDLVKIPRTIGDLQNLTVLYIQVNNFLKDILDEFFLLTGLKKLYCAGTQIPVERLKTFKLKAPDCVISDDRLNE